MYYTIEEACAFSADCFYEASFDFGYLERVTVCQFVNSLFRSLGSVELGYISEEDLEMGEEVLVV